MAQKYFYNVDIAYTQMARTVIEAENREQAEVYAKRLIESCRGQIELEQVIDDTDCKCKAVPITAPSIEQLDAADRAQVEANREAMLELLDEETA